MLVAIFHLPFRGHLLGVSACFSLSFRRGEAATFVLPRVLIVLLVRHHLEDKDLLAGVKDTGNQPVLVTPDVEDGAIAHGAGTAELRFHIAPGLPRDCPLLTWVYHARSGPSAS